MIEDFIPFHRGFGVFDFLDLIEDFFQPLLVFILKQHLQQHTTNLALSDSYAAVNEAASGLAILLLDYR